MIAPIVETVSLAPYSDSFLQIRGHAFIKTRMQDLSHMRVFFHFQLPFSLPAFRLHRAIAVSRGDVFRHSSPFRGGAEPLPERKPLICGRMGKPAPVANIGKNTKRSTFLNKKSTFRGTNLKCMTAVANQSTPRLSRKISSSTAGQT